MSLNVLAEYVKNALNAESWDVDFDARRTYQPSYLLEDLEIEGLQVEVVPARFIPERMTRELIKRDDTIAISVLEKTTEAISENTRKDILSQVCEQISIYFNKKQYNGSTCYKSVYDPLYFPDTLKKQKVFFGLVTLSFTGLETA